MTRRRFLSLLGLAPVATQFRPETPKRRVRRIRPIHPPRRISRLGDWSLTSMTPEDTVRILYDNEPVPKGWRVVTDRWVEWK